MTKSELKTGMIVNLRNGDECMVFLHSTSQTIGERDVLVGINRDFTWYKLEYFKEDLTHMDDKKYDIMKVFLAEHPYCFCEPNKPNYTTRKLVWERKEKKKYTYAQLREILGEEFEVVG